MCREDIDQFEQQEALDSALANMPPEMRDMSELLIEVPRLLTAHRVTSDRRQCRWLFLASFATKVEYEVGVAAGGYLGCYLMPARFGKVWSEPQRVETKRRPDSWPT